MADQKDRFGDTMRLVERARDDIYFAERHREILASLRARLRKVEKAAAELRCPKCSGILESDAFEGFLLDRCRDCGGIWMDKDELEGVMRKISRGPLGASIDRLTAKES